MRPPIIIALFVVAGCGTETDQAMTPDWEYPQVAAEAQRAGDPAKGYDYLINGDYITCGLPKTVYDGAFGSPPAADKLAGRTGDDANLPYYYSAATSAEGIKVVSANCLTCHAGRVNGQLIVGLGSTDHDFTTDQAGQADFLESLLTDPTEIAEVHRFGERLHAISDYSRPATIGVNPADSFTAALMAHHDPATLAWSNDPVVELPPPGVVPVDVPPWWRMGKKHAMFYTAAGRGDHARIMMAASLLCTDTVTEAARIDAAFTDVRAWIASTTAPKWPFPVDANLVLQGKKVFDQTCQRCHGSYGNDAIYPNEVVPLDVVQTDPVLASGSAEYAAPYVAWFAASFWGQTSRMEPQAGYLAPPLDGIWATAPYLHNGSVPTLAALLDSTKRPAYWTRSFVSTDYDQAAVGWKYTALDSGQAAEPDLGRKKKIYDTTLLGYGNGGHSFGDELLEQDRRALIEYLKTL